MSAAAVARRLDSKPVTVAALAERISQSLGPVELSGDGSVPIGYVELDHRRLRSGTKPLFCCVVGERSDGHDFAGLAIEAGAVGLLTEHRIEELTDEVPQIVVGRSGGRAAMALCACAVAGDPARELVTVGVTGTNGKTTTVHLVSAILAEAGYRCEVIGTLSGERTTPEAPELQRRLALVASTARREKASGAVALEVTSHALSQKRVDGYVHDVAVFTNLSQDHLDYHKTMEAYFAAKASLFTPEHARRGVVNSADAYGRRLIGEAGIEVEAFSLDEAVAISFGSASTTFELRGERVELSLVGAPNLENALSAAAAARAVGVDDETVARGLSSAAPVRGRFQRVENELGLSVLVDYAHTPDGLARALGSLRELARRGSRLIVVFGAGGDRDRTKRPLMGEAASEHADVVVVTSDNPRHEDPASIAAQIVEGCGAAAELHVEVDRRAAIALALALAREGDVVLVAGKGHETTQQLGDELVSFDDAEVVSTESRRLAGAA